MADNSIYTGRPLRWVNQDNPQTAYPRAPYALSEEQQEATLRLKEKLRLQNTQYLGQHPEIRAITSMMIHTILAVQPREPLAEFLADFFSRSRQDIEMDLHPFMKKQMDAAMRNSMSLERQLEQRTLPCLEDLDESSQASPSDSKDMLMSLKVLRTSVREGMTDSTYSSQDEHGSAVSPSETSDDVMFRQRGELRRHLLESAEMSRIDHEARKAVKVEEARQSHMRKKMTYARLRKRAFGLETVIEVDEPVA